MNDRFIRLSVSLSRLQKVIQRIKTDGMNRIELKAGHTLVLCQLDAAPDGYRFSELTERCDLDPAMISRVLADVSRRADEGIDPGELAIFYKVLAQLTENLEAVEADPTAAFAPLED